MNIEYRKHIYIESFNYKNDFLALITYSGVDDMLTIVFLKQDYLKKKEIKEYETYVSMRNSRYLTDGIFNPKLALEKVALDFIREKEREKKELLIKEQFSDWDGNIIINKENL